MKNSKIKIGLGLVLSGVFSQMAGLEARVSEVKSLKNRIEDTRAEISHLRTSVTSLESLSKRLLDEQNLGEESFRSSFEKILVPLLHWPNITASNRSPSMVEQQHLKTVLLATRKRIAEKPLQLIADRELRIFEADRMKNEFEQSLKTLESKESMLALQIEELEFIQQRAARKRAASTNKKNQKVSQP